MNSLPKMLFQSAARRPGHVALQDERVELRYGELAARVRDDARRLLSLGLANQGRVAVFLETAYAPAGRGSYGAQPAPAESCSSK